MRCFLKGVRAAESSLLSAAGFSLNTTGGRLLADGHLLTAVSFSLNTTGSRLIASC
jgi:hypothetical protein